jgi:hypothetical protein
VNTIYATTKTFVKPNEARLSRKALLETLDDRATVNQFWQKQPYTCVVITSWFDNKEYQGFGFSKVCYPDKWDPEEGADIAKRRALYMIMHQVRKNEDLESLPF